MGRTIQLGDMIEFVMARADVAGATDRHPREKVVRAINQGRTALRDIIISVRGRSFFRSPTPHPITTTADTSKYDLPSDFYELISIRITETGGDSLEEFTPLMEPDLRAYTADWPSHYELQQSTIELLPLHRAGVRLVVEYIPTLEDVEDNTDEIEGYNGWEDYVRDFAALELAVEDDDEPRRVRNLERSLELLEARIRAQAGRRDRFRAERTKDIRGTRMFGRR